MSGNVVKSAARVFEVLELFSTLQRPLSVREIATRCGYPGSSAAALLTSMKTLGYLAYDDATHAYAPTARLVNLGEALVDSAAGSRRHWHAVAKRLAGRTHEAVVIAVQSDLYVQYIDAVEGSHSIPVQFYAPIGTRREICMSGLGWALLSIQPDSTIRRLVSRSIRRIGKSGRTIDEDVVLDKVEQTRRLGYSYSAHTVTQGAAMISMVIADGTGCRWRWAWPGPSSGSTRIGTRSCARCGRRWPSARATWAVSAGSPLCGEIHSGGRRKPVISVNGP